LQDIQLQMCDEKKLFHVLITYYQYWFVAYTQVYLYIKRCVLTAYKLLQVHRSAEDLIVGQNMLRRVK
jgi:hypothetical protein